MTGPRPGGKRCLSVPGARNNAPAAAGGAGRLGVAVLCLSVGWSGAAPGTSASVGFDIRDVAGDGWRAEGVTVTLTESDDGLLGAVVRVGSLVLPPPVGALSGLEAVCPALDAAPGRLRCESLAIGGTGELTAWPTLSGPFEYRSAAGLLSWHAAVIRDAADAPGGPDAGGIELTGVFGAGPGSASLVLRNLDPGPWLAAWPALGAADGGALSARVDAEVDLALPAAGGPGVTGTGRIRDLSGNNPSGTVAAEAVDLEFEFRLQSEGGTPAFEASLAVTGGEIYRQPVYADLARRPLSVSLDGRLVGEGVALDEIRVEQAGVAAGRGRALVAAGADGGWTLAEAELELDELRLPGAYDVLMQPFLAGTDLGDLETLGSARGELRVADGRLASLSLALDEVYLDDRAGRLAIYALYGDLSWGEGAGDAPVRLLWDGGYLYGFAFGATDLEFVQRDEGIALAAPVAIPVLDGALEIDQLELGRTTDRASAALDARLTPVDMRAVAHALGWPPMSGTLSGRLPRLSYRDGELTLGGEFEAEVFDGHIRIRDFSVREPFGAGARLRADVDIARLDLRQVTEAFSFGLITGRLDGYVRGLTMIDWEPVAFDARLFTSPRDPGRRRISQRAVDNIASLGGGGGAAALSSGFLRFFDDFAYDRMALGCRRELDVCHMSGIESRGDGYLILRGRGLPRITVVGYAREVSWSTLVGQLAAIVASGGPVIE